MSSTTWVIQHRDGLSTATRTGLFGAVVLTHVAMGVTVALLSKPVIEEPPVAVMSVQWIAPPTPAPVPPPPEPVQVRKVEPPKPRKETVVAAKPVKPAEQPVFQAPEPPKDEPPPTPAPPAPPLPAAPAPAPVTPPAPKVVSASEVKCFVAPEPEYPRASKRLREIGVVKATVTIDTRGLPKNVGLRGSSGFPRLDEVALAALRQYRCEPYVEGGVVKEVIVNRNFDFNLD